MASFLPPELVDVASKVAETLSARGEKVSVCETAAGGLISASLLSRPGASKFFDGGLTAYQLVFRKQFIGWTDADTASYKGPTIEIVSKLAANTREKLGSTWTVAESGTAGPTGGDTKNRTPGYVAVAVAGPEGTTGRELNTGSGDREKNMVSFAVETLKLLLEQIQQAGNGSSKV